MGRKLLYIGAIVGAVLFTYLIMFAMQPATNELVSTANASTANWATTDEFEMAQGVMVSWPLWQWLLPGGVGLITVVVALHTKVD